MKNNGVFVVLDWFHYNDSEDSFPVAVTTSFETAKEKARQRAEEAKQEFIAENYSEKRLNIEEIDDDNFAPDYVLGVFHELDGLLEQIAVFQMPVDLGVKTVDSASING